MIYCKYAYLRIKMETFTHIKTVISIILGLSITHSLKGASKLMVHPGRVKPYWIHLLWGFYLFLMTIYFWWFEVHLSEIQHWNFFKYSFVICYAIIYFILSALLFPEDLRDYKDYKDYFYSRRKWFFSILAILFAFDMMDTYIKGTTYFTKMQWPDLFRTIIHIAVCVLAIKSSNKSVHAGIVISFILYLIWWILRFYIDG